MLKGETPYFIGNNFTENLLDSEEFQIFQNNYTFLVLIGRTNNFVTVKSSNYSTNLNVNDISIISGQKFMSTNDLYNFIINIFKNKRIQINLVNNEMNEMNLNLSFYNNNQLKSFQLTMGYSNNNTDYFINHLFNKLTKLETENNALKMNYQNLFQNYQILSQDLNQIKSQMQLMRNNNINNNNINFISNNNNMSNVFMGNNDNEQNIHMSANQINLDSNNTISILFKDQSGKPKTIRGCNLNTTVEQLMNKYREKINNPNFKFCLSFNAKFLNPNITLKEAGLSNLATLNVIPGDSPINN